MNSSDKSIKQSNSSLNEDFWAELDAISETDIDVSHPYRELDDENSSNKSLEVIGYDINSNSSRSGVHMK
ncbi:unnamed protein product [Medioppia subpectinata]|uniref:Uncharacterized protein n=1 Tax=Medioppia subpectinata TaxID=1979941 RepID=A0A7R9KS17_9ACAR|nr:unnamed protein product [Medioppia subpectinata]CAG2108484.1 unnamed protein product [Medioppia subpectinata]